MYPFTNEKKRKEEFERRLREYRKALALRNKPKPPPYNLLDDLVNKFRIEKPEDGDWGPGGLYGFSREELEQQEVE